VSKNPWIVNFRTRAKLSSAKLAGAQTANRQPELRPNSLTAIKESPVAENKTKITVVDPEDFINQVDDEQKREDSKELVRLMTRATGKPPKMWGPSIVGFDKYRYKYESGREGEICLTGFSPRKPNLVLYLGPGLENKELMARLGKHKTGKGCLYIKRLDDIDRTVLKQLIVQSVAEMRRRYPGD
jgi:hypothetical protein